MQTLDWGQITPEGSNLKSNNFIYVYNHDLSSLEKANRTIRFITGRLLYYDLHLPKHPTHNIKIDIRGQKIDPAVCDFIKSEIQAKYANLNRFEIEFVK